MLLIFGIFLFAILYFALSNIAPQTAGCFGLILAGIVSFLIVFVLMMVGNILGVFTL